MNKLRIDPATKLTALRIDITVMPQRVRIGPEAGRGAIIAIENTLFITGELHSAGRHINAVGRIGGAVCHALRQLFARFNHRHLQPRLASAGQMDRQRGAGEPAADNDNLLL